MCLTYCRLFWIDFCFTIKPDFDKQQDLKDKNSLNYSFEATYEICGGFTGSKICVLLPDYISLIRLPIE